MLHDVILSSFVPVADCAQDEDQVASVVGIGQHTVPLDLRSCPAWRGCGAGQRCELAQQVRHQSQLAQSSWQAAAANKGGPLVLTGQQRPQQLQPGFMPNSMQVPASPPTSALTARSPGS